MLQPRQVVTKHSSAKLTYDDFAQIPNDGLLHEIIDGEHYVTPAPSKRHQRILLRLSVSIENHLQQHRVGEISFAPFDVLLPEFDILEPDLLFISQTRSALLTEKNLQGAPNLVLEYWVVDPDHDLSRDDLSTTPLLPGLEIPLAKVFE